MLLLLMGLGNSVIVGRKVCKMMACWALVSGFGPHSYGPVKASFLNDLLRANDISVLFERFWAIFTFYILLGSR